jgi:thioredoxin-like negative regulator of GroEL
MAIEIARPIPGWKPSTPDLGQESLEDLCKEVGALALHFWASWNGVDPLMDRGIQQVADRFVGRVRFLSVDIDTERGIQLAKQFGVANVPTLVVMRTGAEPRLVIGCGNSEELATRIESKLLPQPRQPWWAFWRWDT